MSICVLLLHKHLQRKYYNYWLRLLQLYSVCVCIVIYYEGCQRGGEGGVWPNDPVLLLSIALLKRVLMCFMHSLSLFTPGELADTGFISLYNIFLKSRWKHVCMCVYRCIQCQALSCMCIISLFFIMLITHNDAFALWVYTPFFSCNT